MTETAEQNQARPPASAMRVITISREYGSGGGEIAARLATRLGWRLVDHEVVQEVARRLGVTENDAAQRDEQPESLVDQVLRSFRSVDPTPLSLVGIPDVVISPEAHDYALALRETVLTAANAGNVVIIGRGGQAILSGRRDTLHVRIVCPLPLRVAYVAHRESLDRESAQRRVQKKDHDRHRYLRLTHDRHVDDSNLYDITLNTSVLDLDSCVDLIANALQRKGLKIAEPHEALGPGAGLGAYPSAPSDLPAPAPLNAASTAAPAADVGATPPSPQTPGASVEPAT
ncbi:MAG TPA: cytidylate kinase-like family protein [Ktedonobacterales bacterium]